VNCEICSICGTLFKPFESTCSVCGSECLPDCDDWIPDERIFTDGTGTSDTLIQVHVDQDSDEADRPERH
jgi:hypothetical protein